MTIAIIQHLVAFWESSLLSSCIIVSSLKNNERGSRATYHPRPAHSNYRFNDFLIASTFVLAISQAFLYSEASFMSPFTSM